MRLGFQSPSPFERIEHHHYGDDGWQVSIRKRGDKWTYSTIHARAYFGPDNAPDLYVDHPGDIALFARLHIKLSAARQLEALDHVALDSSQVARLLGEGESAAA